MNNLKFILTTTAVTAGVVCEKSFSEKVVITQKYPKDHLSDCLHCINK